MVDDGSTDGTVEAVRPFEADPRLRLIRQPNMGLSAARNTGIEAGETERVAFLDSDDLWMPDYLEQAHAALESRPDAGFAYTDAWWLDDSSGRFYRASALSRQHPPADLPADPDEFLRMLMSRGNFIFVSATVRRAALVPRAGRLLQALAHLLRGLRPLDPDAGARLRSGAGRRAAGGEARPQHLDVAERSQDDRKPA